MENMNAAGTGGALGTPSTPIYNPDNPVSGDTYAPNNAMNLFGAPPKRGKKGKKGKKKPLVFKRKFPEKIFTR
jgi:hypothetical protein